MDVITVTRDEEGSTGLLPLPLQDITYMEYQKSINRIIIHTLDGIYYTVGTLKYWACTIASTGYDFVLADRNTVINISKIKYIDSAFKTAYFEERDLKNAEKCYLSVKGYEKIVTLIRSSVSRVILN
ncbi:hypothetical protein PSTEL_13035 [Paenibacillus stellifer]|uniref:HTH LytTR-type domain-containing protein n=1 Tax=Paenibacillus stellifer TaxID=169760 RepID=A0A089LSL0_9BACL|nr:LytTR family DNA-binding domain-containing protein [Paenibacillus stellifer]AIQ63872.1 hypothetical protein PSTEL_13035 [Paenibacillus stellifer]